MNKKKIFKILYIILGLLLFWGLVWSYGVTKTVKKNSKNSDLKNQRAIVKNIIVTETQNEKKYWEFYAKSGEYNSEHNSILLNDLIGNFYDKSENVVVSFKSKKGTYDEKSKRVVLNGENLFVGKDGSQLYADELIWQGQDADILANGNVQFIQDNKIITKSQKAIFNSDLTNFKIIGKTKTELFADKEKKKKYTHF
ncbi:MAG: LPS export ABC transporter periplasmic protein LptC [Candidatus Gastranaerophilales bacterium]|nr:LPS export ABC transporter periplasmic protein LptC [Candidatus Gastranaerophilales bacterium]